MLRAISLLTAGCFLIFAGPLHAADIQVAAGQSIQKAIDAAPSGAIIKVAPGLFAEYLTITKPVTLQGAGWDKTIVKPVANLAPHTDAEKLAFVDRLEATSNERQREQLVFEFLVRQSPPTISVHSTHDVLLRGLKIQGIAPSTSVGSGSRALVEFDHADGRLLDSAVLGPCNDGVDILNGSNVEISNTLIAAVWSTGVTIISNSGPLFSAHLDHCSIRNCYYAAVTIHGEGATIDHCRISGAAWHGIRYDNCSPTITANFIFANARSGIYASGNTHATIRNNIFWKNEMDAISCWVNNTDTIENDTIVGNLREGISVVGNSKPLLAHNVLSDNPVALVCSVIAGEGDAAGNPALQDNWFWRNEVVVKRSLKAEPAPAGSTTADPGFANPDEHDFSLTADSPARRTRAGATEIIPVKSHWPLQPEEQAMIPKNDTRDYQEWKKPPAIQ